MRMLPHTASVDGHELRYEHSRAFRRGASATIQQLQLFPIRICLWVGCEECWAVLRWDGSARSTQTKELFGW